MNTPLQPRDRDRLSKIVARFASPHEGERLAAIGAAERILRAAGLSWAELIGTPTTAAETINEGGNDHLDVGAMTYAELARHGRGALTAWELNFLSGCSGVPRLSPKQVRMMAEIRRKVATALAARAACADDYAGGSA